MPPIIYPSTQHKHLSPRRSYAKNASQNYTPASSRATMIIGIVFGVTIFLILLLAFWYHGCLGRWSRKAARDKRKGYGKVEDGALEGAAIVSAVDGIHDMGPEDIGSGMVTVSISGGGGGDFGGGGGGSGDCVVM